MFGPNIEGERVRLAPPTPEMIPTYCRWFADPDVTRYLLLRNPPSHKMEEEWFDRTARSQNDVVWAIMAGNRHIGSSGIHQIDWQNRHAHSGTMIGEKEEWGKGYAGEAVRLRMRYAFEELGLEKLMTVVFAENEASRRALERAGYRQYGLARRDRYSGGRWHDVWMGELLREEWEQREVRG